MSADTRLIVVCNPVPARNPNLIAARILPTKTRLLGTAFQLDLEIAFSGSSSEGSAPSGFISSAEDALKRRMT